MMTTVVVDLFRVLDSHGAILDEKGYHLGLDIISIHRNANGCLGFLALRSHFRSLRRRLSEVLHHVCIPMHTSLELLQGTSRSFLSVACPSLGNVSHANDSSERRLYFV